MIRDILTNKWIIGAVFGLLIVATGCIWYYQHTTVQHRELAEQTDELLKQWEADKQKQTVAVETEVNQHPCGKHYVNRKETDNNRNK